MTRIEVWVHSFKVGELKQAMRDAGATGMTLSETTVLRLGASGAPAGPRAKLETVVHDDLVARVVAAITRIAARSPGAGAEIWLAHVDSAVRIRTGQVHEAAIA